MRFSATKFGLLDVEERENKITIIVLQNFKRIKIQLHRNVHPFETKVHSLFLGGVLDYISTITLVLETTKCSTFYYHYFSLGK